MNRIFVLIGIISQLATTRINRVLRNMDLPWAQFTLLVHLSHEPGQGWTVTHLANALEVNQPAMTKTTQRLLKKGFLSLQSNLPDRRVRLFQVTNEGLQALAEAWKQLEPDLEMLKAPWREAELLELESLLERLKVQLDEARD